jgi:purine nucleosidase
VNTSVILDTDIGTDVDDVVALGVLLRAPTIDLEAVTTVYVDSALRARMVRAVLQAAGRADIQVGRGIDRPLLGRDPIYWVGFEGEGLLDTKKPDTTPWPHAVDMIVERVLARPGQITILAIGPLTNIAMALLREPRVASGVRRIVIMGGIVQRRLDQLGMPYAEHNVRCDPEAAQIVLTSGVPITLVPLDVTTQVRVRRADLRRLHERGGLAALVADQLDRYMTHMGRDWTHPHDPLAAAAVIRPDFLRTQPMRVQVETAGAHTRAQTVAVTHDPASDTVPPVDVALEVDVPGFEQWLLATLSER